MAKKTESDRMAEHIERIALKELSIFPAVSHLRVKAELDYETQRCNEPSEIWRHLANNSKFTFSQTDRHFRINNDLAR